MKKFLPLIACLCLSGSLFAQDTLTGWTFPVDSGPDSLNANLGLPGNLGYDIRFEGTDTTYDRIYFTNGATTFAATTTGWDNGADAKFWSIKFKAENYTNIKVSSKQQSGGNNPGPRDFKLQWRLSGGNWEDIPDGTVTVANDWVTGVVTNLPVPVTNQGTSSIYIRWIMASDTNSAGGIVDADGISKIDDIIVTGVYTQGIDQVLYTNQVKLFPNPNPGAFMVQSVVPLSSITIRDPKGNRIYENRSPGMDYTFSLDLPAGLYLVTVRFRGSESLYTTRMIIR